MARKTIATGVLGLAALAGVAWVATRGADQAITPDKCQQLRAGMPHAQVARIMGWDGRLLRLRRRPDDSYEWPWEFAEYAWEDPETETLVIMTFVNGDLWMTSRDSWLGEDIVPPALQIARMRDELPNLHFVHD